LVDPDLCVELLKVVEGKSLVVSDLYVELLNMSSVRSSAVSIAAPVGYERETGESDRQVGAGLASCKTRSATTRKAPFKILRCSAETQKNFAFAWGYVREPTVYL